VKAEKGVYKADLVKVWEKAIASQKPHREGRENSLSREKRGEGEE
jgi:hypothetical protein